MSAFLKATGYKILAVFLTTSLPIVAASDAIQTGSKIIFNTTCARCHEGECSGRLSFHQEKSAADQHILRHGGELASETVEQLFELLRYMKEECSIYPFSVTLMQALVWNRDTLENFHSPVDNSYFMPLGYLQSGLYQLRFEADHEHPNIDIEIINNEFDFIENERINRIANVQQALEFHVEVPSRHFLRIRDREPIALNRLEFVPMRANDINKSE